MRNPLTTTGWLILVGFLLSAGYVVLSLVDPLPAAKPPISIAWRNPFAGAASTTSQNPAAGAPSTATEVPLWIPSRIVIPAIHLDAPVTVATRQDIDYRGQTFEQWVAPNDFEAGWQVDSAPLGAGDNTVLLGHHNVYGEVFGHLIDLQAGDTILVFSNAKEFAYKIAQKMILPERDQPIEVRLKNAEWIAPTLDERLTLVTCWPHDSNTHRLVIVAIPVDLSAIQDSEMALTAQPPVPTDTPQGVLNPDHAQFVEDVTVPDGTQFAPGTKFTKTWRIKNVGDTLWTQQYTLEYTAGARMPLIGKVSFPQDVVPGQTMDLSVDMVAPQSPGDYTSLFQFRSDKGVPFGVGPEFNENLYARITVVAGPSATP